MSANPSRPFPGLQTELSNLLELGPAQGSAAAPSNGATTAAARNVLLPSSKAANAKPYLPGQPRIALPGASSNTGDEAKFFKYLEQSHLTTELDEILPFMKYIFVSCFFLLRQPTGSC